MDSSPDEYSNKYWIPEAPSERVTYMEKLDEAELARTVCAMANTQGGIVFVGIASPTTTVVPQGFSSPSRKRKKGLSLRYTEQLASFANSLGQHFQSSFPIVRPTEYEVAGSPANALEVDAVGPSGPVRLANGAVYVRKGDFNEPVASEPPAPEPAVQPKSEPDPSAKAGRTLGELLDSFKTMNDRLKHSFATAAHWVAGNSGNRIDGGILVLAIIENGNDEQFDNSVATILARQVSTKDELLKAYQARRSKWPSQTASVKVPLSDTEKAMIVSEELWNQCEVVHGMIDGHKLPELNAGVLLATLLRPPRDGNNAALAELREIGFRDFDDLQNRLVQEVNSWKYYPGQSEIIRLLGEHESDASAVSHSDTARGEIIASFSADDADGEDQLGITRDVRAMARLVASRELHPPLAIGLFGNWGSGKSFFMRLLQERILKLAQISEPEKPISGGSVVEPGHSKGDAVLRQHYWSNIVPIEFNAWHYADANLWASLVSHIFESLNARWKCNSDNDLNEMRKDAIRELDVANAALTLAEDKQRAARIAQDDALSRKSAGEAALLTDQAQLNMLKAVTVQQTLPATLKAVWDGYRNEHPEIGRSLDALRDQFHDLRGDAKSLDAQILEAHTFLRRVGPALRAAIRSKIVLCMLAAAIAVSGLVYLRPDWLADNFQWVPEWFNKTAGQVLAWVSAGLLLLQQVVSQFRSVATSLDGLKQRLQPAIQEAEDRRQAEVQSLEARVEQKQKELNVASAEVEKAQQAVAEATRELADVLSAKEVKRFIEQRIAAGDYQRQLGVISTIHNEFKTLSRLISAFNKFERSPEGVTSRPATSNELQQAENQEKTQQDIEKGKTFGINRIVLFIDDLDRCRPKRVTEVLEAVHLLLAFPVFVVVVAVDARWMKHSLATEYPHLGADLSSLGKNVSGAQAAGPPISDDYAATPKDYLEKIFQVPYWIRQMDGKGCGNLLDELTKPAVIAPPDADDTETSAGQTKALGNVEQVRSAPQKTAEVPPDNRAASTGDEQAAKTEADSARVKTPVGTETKTETPSDSDLVAPVSLVVEDGEREKMKELASIIGRTPREAKRFVNVYRVIKAALRTEQVGGFYDPKTKTGNFVAPMLLLAIVTGMPALTRNLLRCVQRLAKDSKSKLPVAKFDSIFAAPELSGLDPRQAADLTRLQSFLKNKKNEDWANLELPNFEGWSSRIAQFTFEFNDLDASE
jgi:hypothetical protein